MFCHNSHLFVMRNGYSSYELGVCNHYVYFNSKKKKKVSSLFITKYFRRFSFRKHPPFRKKKIVFKGRRGGIEPVKINEPDPRIDFYEYIIMVNSLL